MHSIRDVVSIVIAGGVAAPVPASQLNCDRERPRQLADPAESDGRRGAPRRLQVQVGANASFPGEFSRHMLRHAQPSEKPINVFVLFMNTEKYGCIIRRVKYSWRRFGRMQD